MRPQITFGILALLVLGFLSGCSSYDVKLLETGATIRAKELEGRSFKPGDTVCVIQNNQQWMIEDGPMFKDTIIISSDSQYTFVWHYYLGVVKE